MITESGVIGEYYALLEKGTAESYINQLSSFFTSDQALEDYSWLGNVPKMREWIGGRHAPALNQFSYTLRNKKFEATVDIECDWLRRDKTGQVQMAIAQLVDEGIRNWEDLLSTIIKDGQLNDCYDGKKFFATDHSQYNLLTATEVPALSVTDPTKPTVTEAIDAILGAIAYMMTYTDDQSRLMNSSAKSFTIVSSPKLWPYLVHATVGEIAQGGASNVIAELKKNGWNVEVVPNGQLTYTTEFDVFRTDGRVKALIRQEEDLGASSLTKKAEGSDYEHDTDRHQYGVKKSRNVGYGLWQYACHCTMS